MELRQRIEKQLNKVESSNKFSKAVFFGNNSEFQVATVEEQNIANNSKCNHSIELYVSYKKIATN